MNRMNNQKSKRERFETVAAKRVEKILNGLDVLGKCSSTNNYEYDDKDIQKMFKAIKDKTRQIEVLFEQRMKKKRKNNFKF